MSDVESGKPNIPASERPRLEAFGIAAKFALAVKLLEKPATHAVIEFGGPLLANRGPLGFLRSWPRRRVDGKHAHARVSGCSASAINWLDISKRIGPDPCRGGGPCFLELRNCSRARRRYDRG